MESTSVDLLDLGGEVECAFRGVLFQGLFSSSSLTRCFWTSSAPCFGIMFVFSLTSRGPPGSSRLSPLGMVVGFVKSPPSARPPIFAYLSHQMILDAVKRLLT